MKQHLLVLGSLVLLASCNASKDDSQADRTRQGFVPRIIVVECVLYDGMTKESQQLATVTSGTEVQVTDTANAYFVKVRATAAGKTQNGYMYRTCFAQN